MSIKLIVGLGNPGPKYTDTRHNAGAWFVELLAEQYQVTLKAESRFGGLIGKFREGHHECHLLIPTTFMNDCGRAVSSVAKYFKIAADEILVAHDELDLPLAQVRLKAEGGHGGHNGLRDIISALSTKQFHRLRIGIDHPGDKDKVTSYVLSSPGKAQRNLIDDALTSASHMVPDMLAGDMQHAMRTLHS